MFRRCFHFTSMRFFVFLITLFCFCQFSNALFEYQVGSINWQKQFIGKVRWSHYIGGNEPSLVVGASSGGQSSYTSVVAKIKRSNGNIIWRKVLPENEILYSLDVVDTKESKFIVAISYGKLSSSIRLWDLKGDLLWNSFSPYLGKFLSENHDKKISVELSFVHMKNGKQALLVSCGEVLAAFCTTTGKLFWELKGEEVKEGNMKFYQLLGTPDPNNSNQFIEILACDDGACFVSYVDTSGTVKESKDLKFKKLKPSSLGYSSFRMDNGIVLFTRNGDFTAVGLSPKNKEPVFEKKGIEVIIDSFGSSEFEIIFVGGSIVQCSSSTTTAFFTVEWESEKIKFNLLSIIKTEKESQSIPLAKLSPDKRIWVLMNKFSEKNFKVGAETSCCDESNPNFWFWGSVDYRKTKNEKMDFISCFDMNNQGKVVGFFPISDVKKNRAVVVGEDYSMSYFHKKCKALWVREEGLSSIMKTMYSEKKSSEPFIEGSEFPSLFERIPIQIHQLLSYFSKLLKISLPSFDEKSLVNAFTPSSPSSEDFGFSQIVVALSRSGKVFALDSLTGNIVWSKLLTTSKMGFSILELYSVGKHKVAVVVKPMSESPKDAFARVFILSSLDGDILEEEELAYDLIEVRVLPFKNAQSFNVLMFIDSYDEVHLYPEGEESTELFQEKRDSYYFYSVNPDSGSLTGHAVKKISNQGKLSKFKSIKVWSMEFPLGVEEILNVKFSIQNEVIQSSTKVIGEGSKLFKYINPNALVLITERKGANLRMVPKPYRANDIADPSICLYVIDGVTGNILEKVVHRHGSGPAQIVIRENQILYSFFNEDIHQTEIVSLELYEEKSKSFYTKLDESSFSSFEKVKLQNFKKSYSFPYSVKLLSSPLTRYGISDKNLLIGLSSDQLYHLHRKFVDARRPKDVKPTQEGEALPPYEPVLPFIPTSVLTYYEKVVNMRGINTSPTLLESTSLIFIWGLDIHHTRIAPSEEFDMLSEDFNGPMLIVTVFVVSVATILSRYFATRKILKNSWA